MRVLAAVLLALAGLVVLLAATWPLIDEPASGRLGRDANVVTTESVTYLPGSPRPEAATIYTDLPKDRQRFDVLIMVESFDPRTGELDLTVSVDADLEAIGGLRAGDRQKPIGDYGPGGQFIYEPPELIKTRFSLQLSTDREPQTLFRPVPLTKLLDVPIDPLRGTLPTGVTTAFELSAVGDPGRYPSDVYGIAGTLALTQPGRRVFLRERSEVGIPVDVAIAAGAGLHDKDVVVEQRSVESQDAPDVVPRFSFSIERPMNTRVLVYCLGVLPLILGAVVLTAFVRRRETSDELVAGIVNVGIAMIAVLTIRQVLVPEEIPVLTRLDYLLAFDIGLLIGGFLLLFAFKLWPRRSAS